MITKDLFVKTINAIESQTRLDQHNSKLLSGVFETSKINLPNELYKPLIELLQYWFPRDENNFCEIEHFCGDLDFGRESEGRMMDASDLYDNLINSETRQPIEFSVNN